MRILTGGGLPPENPHHPGPLLPASPPSAGRRGRKARTPQPGPLGAPASRRQLTLLLAPSLPAGGGEAGREGVGGVRVRPAGALGEGASRSRQRLDLRNQVARRLILRVA